MSIRTEVDAFGESEAFDATAHSLGKG